MRENKITLIASDNIFKKYFTEAVENLNLSLRIIDSNSSSDHTDLHYIIINDNSVLERNALSANFYFINKDYLEKKDINVPRGIVTYGIGMKNTITISSLEENNFVYCIQQYLYKNNNEPIEPQEIPIRIELYNETHLYALMVAITIGLIEGMKGKEIEKKLSKKYLSI